MSTALKTNSRSCIAIIQARMGSTRLPGKVLEDISGYPMLWHVVSRTRRAHRIDDVVVATSDKKQDDPIAAFCRKEKISFFRGSESDVLDRYYQCAVQFKADIVVRITADCPLVDAQVIDQVVEGYLKSGCDYASNISRYTFPEGLDTEVFSFGALSRAWKEATKPSEREHVTPFLRTSGLFSATNVENANKVSGEDYHWSVDSPKDLLFVRQVFSDLKQTPDFGMEDILMLLARSPQLKEINEDQVTNEGYYRTLYGQAKAGTAPKRSLTENKKWLERAKQVIPGCAQTFSKAYHQHVQGVSPIFLQRGKGCRVWDVDGNAYIDYIQGLLPNILGYAHVEVNAAAAHQLAEGHSFSLPHPSEVLLAEKLTKIIPCAEMVRFGKNGSDATAGAVRAARAFTNRERVAVGGYHGWQDWYIGSTTRHRGVPAAVRGLTHAFPYNHIVALEKLLSEHKGEFAAVVLEPFNFIEPKPGYLEGVKAAAKKHGALLIFDEICTGFHFGLGGAQKKFNVIPDLATFGKAMGNGFPISCIVGRRDVMEIFNEIFYSFTFGGEAASIAASLKVIEILETTDALARIEATGKRLKVGFNALAKEAGLQKRFECIGYPQWAALKFRDAAGKDSFLERTLFVQEAAKRGVLLLLTHNLTAAHDDASTERTLEVYAAVFKTLAGWLTEKHPEQHLEGPVIQPVFKLR